MTNVEQQRRNRWFAVGALVVAAIALGVITIGGIGENLVYYWGPTDIRNNAEKAVGATIRLGGQVAPKSIQLTSGSNLEFDVTDGKNNVHVISAGVPPQMFREGIGVVVEGTMTSDGYFKSNRLMVSHNNEYKAPAAGEQANVKELIDSTKGIDAKATKNRS